jgi:hypothetical protein
MRMRGRDRGRRIDGDPHKQLLVTVDVSPSMFRISRYSYSYRYGEQLEVR